VEGIAVESSLTVAVARYIEALRFEDLPAAVVAKAKEVILDALACQLACAQLPHCQMAIEFARGQVGRAEASVIGAGFKTSVEHAALVNGILGHGDEIDQGTHFSAVLVSAVLAVAERERASGQDMIVALVAGYDLAVRLRKAGFRLTLLAPHNREQSGSAGSIAAAAAAGKLLGLGQAELQAAIGLGAEQACGLQAMRTETGHMNKSLHMGIGSRNGITAAYLAQAGYGGALTVLDPPYSVFAAFVPEGAKPDELIHELGQRFDILETRFKRYASGSPTHCAIAAMLHMMTEQHLVAADLERIVVKVPTIEQSLLSRALTLNINYEYIVAVAALDGRVSWEQYSEERQRDPVLRDLWQRVTTVGDPELDAINQVDGARPAEVTIHTRDGRTFTERMLYPPGHPRNPLSPSEMAEKFMYWSTRTISRDQATRLHAAVDGLEHLTDANELGDLLRT
jgi:2-methylcitrate dehydratase PrpD